MLPILISLPTWRHDVPTNPLFCTMQCYCGPTARVTLAWGNAPGQHTPITRGLKARLKRLIPHKLLIKPNPILRKHRPHFRLKITPPMMRTLRIDIPHQRPTVLQPNGERRVPTLPTKLGKLRTLGLDPLGRRDFQPLHDLRHRLRPRQEKRQVDMIGNAADPHTNVLRVPKYRSHVGMHFRTYAVVEKRLTVLCAEHKVHQYIGKGLGHGEV